METFASLWWLYLVATTFSYGYAAYNQARQMKRMWDSSGQDLFEDPLRGMTKGSPLMAVAIVIATLSFGALVVSALYWLAVAITS